MSQLAVPEDRVRRRDDQRRRRTRGKRPLDRIRGAEHVGLIHEPDLQSEGRAAANELFDLLGEMARDQPDATKLRGGEVSQKRGNHRPTVDRQDRLRPQLGQRTKARAFACRHHDGVHG